MKKILLAYALLIITYLANVSSIAYGGIAPPPEDAVWTAVNKNSRGTVTNPMGFQQWLPNDYSASGNTTYKLIIFLHGSGQRGNGSTDLYKVLEEGLPRQITSLGWNGQTGSTKWIILCPQQSTSFNGWVGNPNDQTPNDGIEFINWVKNHSGLRIDWNNGIYITGLSMGAPWSVVGYTGANYPANYFAAMSAYAGGANYAVGQTIGNRDIPVWALMGGNDNTTSNGSSIKTLMGQTINGINSVTPSTPPIYNLNVGTYGHTRAFWDYCYNWTNANYTPNLYEWFLTKSLSPPSNQAPTVNAGLDKILTLPNNSTTLNGIASDSDGTISTYAWSQTSGSAATLTNIATANLTASGLVVGTYVFKLTVTDNGGATNFDEVTVVVNPAPNVAPTANAGADKTITLPTNTITLNGSGTDSDGTIAAYLWAKVSGPTYTQSGETTANLTLSGLVLGVYEFQLTVTDNQGGTGIDNVTVTVLADPIPKAPSNLSATAVSASQINLSWTDGSNNETEFNVERSTDALNFATIHSSLANETSYIDTYQLIPATTYYYRISAVNTSGSSAYSSVASAITFKLTPTWINKLNVTEDAAGTLTKSNSAVLAGASSQEVLAANADGWVETEVDQLAKSRTIGLSDVDVDKTKSTIDYGIELGANNNVYTWESGVRSNNTVDGSTLNCSIGEVYRIERQNNAILFKRNGVTFRTAVASSTSSLVVDVNMETINGRLYNNKISFGSSGSAPGGRVASSHAIIESNKNTTIEPGNSLAVYPNPVSSILFISLPEKTEEALKIRILDNTGKVEWEGVAKSGSEVISIDLASTRVSSGIKIISIVKSNGEVVHKRLQKID